MQIGALLLAKYRKLEPSTIVQATHHSTEQSSTRVHCEQCTVQEYSMDSVQCSTEDSTASVQGTRYSTVNSIQYSTAVKVNCTTTQSTMHGFHYN